jgi:class 3 adenylate cyclase/TolB-like protein
MGEALARDHRRLAAIVSADVVGYSLLMGRDDSATLAGLKAHRQGFMDPKIAEYGGRIVKSTGDGLLLEFPSVVDAVRCAVDVQRGMAERNAGVPAEQRIDFRIGINIGDIIIDGDDIFGDGVNVAARLQTLAEPGGICVSRVVRDQVLDKLSFAFEDLGVQEVKNIGRPVEVYRVDFGGAPLQGAMRIAQHRKRFRRVFEGRRVIFVMIGLVLGLAGVAFWLQPWFWRTAPAGAPTSVSVAVLPFFSSGGAAADEKVADALAPDLASALGRSARWAKVISSQLSAAYKGPSVDARRVGLELNVRYLIEGKVQRTGKRGVIKLAVIDARSATALWNGYLEFEDDQLAQDSASSVATLTRQVYLALYDAEMRRTAGTPAAGASAMDLTWHGWAVMNRDENTEAGAREARKWFDQALRLEPGLVLALRGRWRTLRYEYDLDPHADRTRLLQEMDDLSFRMTSIDENDSHAWWDRAETLSRQRRWEAALEANARALTLDPSFGGPRNQRAAIMIAMGKPAEALAIIDQELARNPQEPSEVGAAMLQRCRASLALGRYGDAIAACEKDIALDNWWLPNVYLLAAYAQNGDAANVATAKATAIRLRPGLSISDLKALWYSNSTDAIQQTEGQLLAGLRKAGIPEQ